MSMGGPIATAKKKPLKKKSKAIIARTEREKRDKKLVKLILSNPKMPINEAMIKAGFSESTANKQSKRTVEKSSIQTAMQKAMEKAGITDESLAESLKDGLSATRTISAIAGTKANGGTVDFVDVPDYQARKGFQDMAHKLRVDYPDSKVDIALNGDSLPQGITINFVPSKGE